jgi:hypothetical protein
MYMPVFEAAQEYLKTARCIPALTVRQSTQDLLPVIHSCCDAVAIRYSHLLPDIHSCCDAVAIRYSQSR